MGLLKPAENMTAYAKIGILGFAGSGKTFTAANIAVGLAKVSKSNQVAFFDTEKGSDFVIKPMKEQGVDLLVHRGRAFRDLIQVIREAEDANIPVLIIDSISHVWRDLCDSYAKKYNRKRLTMGDWTTLKGQWKDYTDLFINSKLHILMLGRAGFEYDFTEDEDGKKEIVKTGTKMKVEGETGFEPDLLLEMERIKDKGKIINRCFVVKDRSNTMNGNDIDYPTFDSFKSFFSYINIGGEHTGIDNKRDSTALFDDPDYSYEEKKKRREIACEEIKDALIRAEMDGTGKEEKKKRSEVFGKIFGTASWTAISTMPLRELLDGLERLKVELGLVVPEKPKFDEDDVPFVTNGKAAANG